ncbi:MAG: 50S ribosomal protein L20 [Candidatus Jacksonbacteria bacterium]
MPRVKRGITHSKKRRKILKATKGFKIGRKNLIKLAKTAAVKAGWHAYVDRRRKKRDFRSLWNIKINAIAKQNNITYSQLIHLLKVNNIALDRKILAQISEKHPNVFKKIVEHIK